jgi:SagB-type dehydrogenase family enzyme
LKIRVDPSLHLHFDRTAESERRTLVLDHLGHMTRFQAPSVAALVALDAARDWISEPDYIGVLCRLGLSEQRARQFIGDGVERGLLQRHDEARSPAPSSAAIWDAAGCTAAYRLKLAKSHQVYLDYATPDALAAEAELMTAYRAESAPPDIYQDDPDDGLVALCNPAEEPPLGQAAGGAATHPPALDRAWLSALLRHAVGQTGSLHDEVQGRLLLKTHPSGGARHPVECYVAGRGVAGIAPFVYHYSVRRHALSPLPGSIAPEALAAELFPDTAPALIVLLTAIPRRVMWRYREPTSFCVMLLDVGHALESFAMICRSTGIGHATNLAPRSIALARLLGMPLLEELPLAAISIDAVGSDA